MENTENSSAPSANENISDNKDGSRNITTGTTNSSPNPFSPSVPSNEATTITALSTANNANNKNKKNIDDTVISSGQTAGVAASTSDSTPLAVTAGACTLLPSTAVVVDSERSKVGISGTETISNDMSTDSGGAKEMTPTKSVGGTGAPLATAATQSKIKEALVNGTGGTVNPKISSSKSSLGGASSSRIGTATEKKTSISTGTAKTTTLSSSSGGTKSLKKGARKKRKTVVTGTNDDAEKEGNSAPKKKKVKRKKVRKPIINYNSDQFFEPVEPT